MPSVKVTDHLANERTFLAWVRTSIALMGFGVVIARLRFIAVEMGHLATAAGHTADASTQNHSTYLGLAFAGVGLVTLIFATLSYNRNRRAIDAGQFEPLANSLMVFAVILFLLGIFAIGYLLTLSSD
jgi:putative membrane protein